MGRTIKNAVLRLIKRKSFEEKAIPELESHDSSSSFNQNKTTTIQKSPTEKLTEIDQSMTTFVQKAGWLDEDIAKLEKIDDLEITMNDEEHLEKQIKNLHVRRKQGCEFCMRLLEELDSIVLGQESTLPVEDLDAIRDRRKVMVKAVQELLNKFDEFADRLSNLMRAANAAPSGIDGVELEITV